MSGFFCSLHIHAGLLVFALMNAETISSTSVPKQSLLQKSSAVDFMESYNNTIPRGFPHLTEELQKKFKVENPNLFKEGEHWSIDKHRKEVVDWFQVL
jgi:hypothetical protein